MRKDIAQLYWYYYFVNDNLSFSVALCILHLWVEPIYVPWLASLKSH